MEYLKLIGLKVGAFETTVKEENNFADSEEGRMNLEKTAQEWEKKGLVCVRMTLQKPDLR